MAASATPPSLVTELYQQSLRGYLSQCLVLVAGPGHQEKLAVFGLFSRGGFWRGQLAAWLPLALRSRGVKPKPLRCEFSPALPKDVYTWLLNRLLK